MRGSLRLGCMLAAGAACWAQSAVPDKAEFTRVLKMVLAEAKAGAPGGLFHGVPRQAELTLPGARYCLMFDYEFTCRFDSKPNKYSAAMLHEDVAENIAAIVPGAWSRKVVFDNLGKTTTFMDPRTLLAISVTSAAREGELPVGEHAVTLRIH
jgi:hypothetical protein